MEGWPTIHPLSGQDVLKRMLPEIRLQQAA
jgi:hypothetical protein